MAILRGPSVALCVQILGGDTRLLRRLGGFIETLLWRGLCVCGRDLAKQQVKQAYAMVDLVQCHLVWDVS